jgi:outer membrane lipoprotein carrier protein
MLGGAPAHAAPAAPSDAAELVRAVERRYASIKSLTGSFTQTFRSGELGQHVSETGRIFMRRPGQMRWDYRQPDKKVFLVNADGTTLAYIPADMTATRSRIPATAPHLQLLMGQSDLLATFAASEVQLKDAAFPGSRQIKLVPRQPMEGIEMVYLEIDPRLLTVGRVLVMDPLGNESDLVLQKVEENAPVRADTFDLRLPAGVETVDAIAAGGQ